VSLLWQQCSPYNVVTVVQLFSFVVTCNLVQYIFGCWDVVCHSWFQLSTDFSWFCLCLSENLKFCIYLNFILAQAAGQIHGREDYRGLTSATGYDFAGLTSFLNIILILPYRFHWKYLLLAEGSRALLNWGFQIVLWSLLSVLAGSI